MANEPFRCSCGFDPRGVEANSAGRYYCPWCGREFDPSVVIPSTGILIPGIQSVFPPANAQNMGLLNIHQAEGGSRSEIYMCLKNSARDYEWVEVGEST